MNNKNTDVAFIISGVFINFEHVFNLMNLEQVNVGWKGIFIFTRLMSIFSDREDRTRIRTCLEIVMLIQPSSPNFIVVWFGEVSTFKLFFQNYCGLWVKHSENSL